MDKEFKGLVLVKNQAFQLPPVRFEKNKTKNLTKKTPPAPKPKNNSEEEDSCNFERTV